MVPSPIITAKCSDSTGLIKDNLLNNVSDAYLYIELNAATSDEIASYKSQGTQIAIDGYSFKIFVFKGTEKQEAYNSGSLSGGKEEKIIINKKLQDYIDVTGVTEVSIEVIAINTLGGITNTNTTIGEHDEKSESTIYDDNIKPKCVKPDSPYEESDWLNKREYNLTKDQRKLTVGCNDGTGSGCIRNYFTMSWPNDDDKYGAEFVYIEVKDNAGNVSEHNNDCLFRVNVDIKTPEATIPAYSGQPSTSTSLPNVTISSTSGTTKVPSNTTHILANKIAGKPSILSKSVSVNDTKTSATITSVDYKNLTANTTNVQWMNKANYPEGVVYRIDLKDNIRLDKWTWETNAGYLNDTKAKKYKSVSVNNPEGSSGSIAQDEAHGKTIFNGSTADTIFVQFVTEGMRYGVFTVYDKAGNSTKIEIAANLDRTPPPVPTNMDAYQYNKVRTEGTSVNLKSKYTFGTWINRYVQVKTSTGQNRDDLTQGVTLSGFWQFYYDARNNANTRVGTSDYSTNALGQGVYNFKGTASEVDGKNKIRFMGCDKAGNCSEWSMYKDVWIDITIPVCAVAKSITSGAESDQLWLGIGETARVTATCSDPTTTQASGCTVGSFYHDYNYQINTHTAGAEGNGKPGSFTDYAGNSVTCTAGERIQIDYVNPTCSVSGGSTAWTNNQRVVVGTCSDTGGSGCRGNFSHTYNYDIETSSGGPAGKGNGGYVYDRADNRIACAANQTVKVDRTNPYVVFSPDPAVTYKNNSGINTTATCKDALSGLSGQFDVSFSAHQPSPNDGRTGIGKCCEDKAGNLMCDTATYSVMHECAHEVCGVKEYKSCRSSGCGVETYKSCSSCSCKEYTGWSSYTQTYYVGDCDKCTYKSNPCKETHTETYRATCEIVGGSVSGNKGYAVVRKTMGSRICMVYNRCSSCGVETYKYCAHSQCGVKSYKTCWHLSH